MEMKLMRLADLSVIYKVYDILYDEGFPPGKYRVIDGYPNNIDFKTSLIWPLISIDIDNLYGRNIELGSDQWPACQITIDVFAKTDSQRDDISYLLWDTLNESNQHVYNFNSAFPSTASGADYTGIYSRGNMFIDNLSIVNVPPPENAIAEGENHHSMIVGILSLPNL